MKLRDMFTLVSLILVAMIVLYIIISLQAFEDRFSNTVMRRLASGNITEKDAESIAREMLGLISDYMLEEKRMIFLMVSFIVLFSSWRQGVRVIAIRTQKEMNLVYVLHSILVFTALLYAWNVLRIISGLSKSLGVTSLVILGSPRFLTLLCICIIPTVLSMIALYVYGEMRSFLALILFIILNILVAEVPSHVLEEVSSTGFIEALLIMMAFLASSAAPSIISVIRILHFSLLLFLALTLCYPPLEGGLAIHTIPWIGFLKDIRFISSLSNDRLAYSLAFMVNVLILSLPIAFVPLDVALEIKLRPPKVVPRVRRPAPRIPRPVVPKIPQPKISPIQHMRIGGYEVIKKLGEGAYAEVFLVKDSKGHMYAMKIFKTEAARPPTNKELIKIYQELSEIMRVKVTTPSEDDIRDTCPWSRDPLEILKIINRYKRYIVNIYDFNKEAWKKITDNPEETSYKDVKEYESNPPFTVFEYADAGSLMDIRRELLLRGKEFVLFIDKVLGGLAFYYVATRGGVHCDIKPGNILAKRVNSHLDPVLVDFGIARRLGELNPSGWNIGTPQYMPPEHLLYPERGITPDFDVYSVGITLYEVLTEEIPLRQYCFLAISRHPFLPKELRDSAKTKVELFENAILSTSGVILPRVEEVLYPEGLVKILLSKGAVIGSRAFKVRLQNERLKLMEKCLREDKFIRSIASYERRKLEDALDDYGLQRELGDIIMKAMSINPVERYHDVVQLWFSYRKVMGID